MADEERLMRDKGLGELESEVLGMGKSKEHLEEV
jgi:hypothetical protein